MVDKLSDNAFDQYLNGRFTFKFEDFDKKVYMKPTMDERLTLHSLFKKQFKEDLTDEDILKRTQVLIDCLKRSQPNMSDEMIEGFIMLNDQEALYHLWSSYGWIKGKGKTYTQWMTDLETELKKNMDKAEQKQNQ